MRFIEYLEKPILEEIGFNDFVIQDFDLKELEKAREQYKSFKYERINGLLGLILMVVLFIVSYVVTKDWAILTLIKENGEDVMTLLIIYSVLALCFELNNKRKLNKKLESIIRKNFSATTIFQVEFGNCFKYKNNRYVVLAQRLVDELKVGELDINYLETNSKDLLKLEVREVSLGLEQGVRLELDEDKEVTLILNVDKRGAELIDKNSLR